MFNRLHNCTNPNQGSAKKVLCVCSAGLLRSPTAANVLHKEFGFNTRACGISKDHALIPFDAVLGAWADEIVVMEKWMLWSLPDDVQDKAFCLEIEDRYEYMNKELQQLIKEKYIGPLSAARYTS